MSFPFNYGMSIYMPPGPDMDRVDKAWDSLGSLLESRQNDKDTNSVAQMAAERMRGLGPQGEQWAKMIQTNPRAALASMEQYGGPMEIENQIIGARAAGDASARWGKALEGSELKPEELQIMIEAGPVKGPAALKAYRDSMGGGEGGPSSYTTAEGKYIRDPAAPGGYRRVGSPFASTQISVGVGESGMKPEQAVAAEDRSAGAVDSRLKPLETSLDAYAGFVAVYNKVMARDGVPTLDESDTLSKLSSRVETGEAVNEGDIARKSGGGLMNAWRSAAGTGVLMSPETMQSVAETTKAVAESRRKILAEVQSGAQSVAEDRGLNPNAVVRSRPSGGSSDPGQTRTINGVTYKRKPGGSGWVKVK